MTKHEREIKKLLYGLNITPEIKGYHYLVEAITIKEQADATQDFNKCKTMSIYHDVAEKFHTEQHNVERAIRHAIHRSSKNKTPLFLAIFEPVLSVGNKNITNACFIAMIAEHIASQEAID